MLPHVSFDGLSDACKCFLLAEAEKGFRPSEVIALALLREVRRRRLDQVCLPCAPVSACSDAGFDAGFAGEGAGSAVVGSTVSGGTVAGSAVTGSTVAGSTVAGGAGVSVVAGA